MQRKLIVDVAILGGGCAGLWLVHDFAKRGLESALLEYGPLGQYASQGNQGWLHSGALYGVFDSEQKPTNPSSSELRTLARECRRGYVRLRRFARRHCKNALDNHSGCMFLYDDGDKAERARLVLKSYGMEPTVYNSHLEFLEPILAGTQAHMALMTNDMLFDAGRMLSAVTRRAAMMGAQFIDTNQALDKLEIIKDGQQFVVKGDSLEITASILVFATGALAFSPRAKINFLKAKVGIQKCEVAVFDTRISTRLLSFRIPEANELSVVPFRGGTTLNLNASDTCTADVFDRTVGHTCFQSLANVLSIYMPGIKKWRVPVRAHAYICQKIANEAQTSRPVQIYGRRHYFWSEAEDKPGLYYVYPGKFTLGANCSSAFVNEILASGRLHHRAIQRTRSFQTPTPGISVSPYHAQSTHLLVKDKSGDIQFIPRLA